MACVLASCAPIERAANFDPYGPVYWSGVINLTENHFIGAEDILLVRPGTRIVFNSSGLKLDIEGFCEFRGTKLEPIIFEGPGMTNDIIVSGTGASNIFRFCDFGENRLIIYKESLVSDCKARRVEMDGPHSSTLSRSTLGYLLFRNSNQSEVAWCVLDRAAFAVQDILGNMVKNVQIEDVSSPVLHMNNIMGNSSLPGQLSDYVVLDYSSANLDMRNNYWRSNNPAWISNELLFDGSGGIDSFTPVLNAPVSSVQAGAGW